MPPAPGQNPFDDQLNFHCLPEKGRFFLVGGNLNHFSIQDISSGEGWAERRERGRKSGLVLYGEQSGEDSGETLM